MEELNLRNRELVGRLLAGEVLYFAEEDASHDVFPEGRAEELVRLEEELVGLPVRINTQSRPDSTPEEEEGVYRGVQQISNGARSAGMPVSVYDIVYYWHDVFYAHGRIEKLRDRLVLSGDTPDECIDMLKGALPAYQFKYVGRSGFASRNKWVIKGCPSEICQILQVDVRCLDRNETERVGLPLYPVEQPSERLIWYSVSATLGEMEIFDTSQIDDAYAQTLAECRKVKQAELVGNNPKAILSVEIGGTTGFTEQHLPEGYTTLFEVVTAYEQDCRQSRTHRRRLWLADLSRLKAEGCRQLKLDIPSGHRGKFIGKGGRNIKNLEAKIGLKIKLM